MMTSIESGGMMMLMTLDLPRPAGMDVTDFARAEHLIYEVYDVLGEPCTISVAYAPETDALLFVAQFLHAMFDLPQAQITTEMIVQANGRLANQLLDRFPDAAITFGTTLATAMSREPIGVEVDDER